MMGSSGRPGAGCVADTMVLAMFVDADRSGLLVALAGESLPVPPSIADPEEAPPFARPPISEFAQGAFYLQQRLARPLDAVRFSRRMAFYAGAGAAWLPVALSAAELALANSLTKPATWQRAATIDPRSRVKRIGRGEAECAAVAVTRGLTPWSADTAIRSLVAALHAQHPVERISDLLARAVREGLMECEEAAVLYNDVFKGTLRLWTTLTLACRDGQIVV